MIVHCVCVHASVGVRVGAYACVQKCWCLGIACRCGFVAWEIL